MRLRNRLRRNLIVQGVGALCLSLAMVGWPGLVVGQQPSMPNASDDEVKAFAKAHVQVTRILSVAEAEEEIPKTIAQITPESVPHKETRERMIQAIKAEGLTLDAYNALMQAYQTDESFRSKVTMTLLDLH